jgi:hypothetical protein
MDEGDFEAAGKLLQQALMQIVIRMRTSFKPFNEADERRRVEANLQAALEKVRREVRPIYEKQPYLFSEGVRQFREFESEYSRLRNRALGFYISDLTDQHPELKKILDSPPLSASRADMFKTFREYIERLIVPIIEKYPSAGEDLYLLIYSIIFDGEKEPIVDAMVKSGHAAPEDQLATVSVLSLLINARRERDAGNLEVAYSFLLDAAHLIGMREGARSVTKYLPDLTKKLHHSNHSHKSRDKKREAARRAAELFIELRPVGERGLRKAWSSGSAAADAIWSVMEKEAYKENREIGIKYSGLKKYCTEWCKDEENGGTLDIRVRWIRVPPG